MRLTWKDGLATILFAAIVVPYSLYVAWGGISFIGDGHGGTSFGIVDPTGMAGWALIFGALAAYVGGWVVRDSTRTVAVVTGGLGLISLVLGGLAVMGENLFSPEAWAQVLGAFVGTIVLLWGIAIVRHAGLVSPTAPTAARPA